MGTRNKIVFLLLGLYICCVFCGLMTVVGSKRDSANQDFYEKIQVAPIDKCEDFVVFILDRSLTKEECIEEMKDPKSHYGILLREYIKKVGVKP